MFSVNDMFCTVDGQPGMTISRIADDRIFIRGSFGEYHCGMGAPGSFRAGCPVPFANGLWYYPKKPIMDAAGTLRVEVTFERR